MRERDEKNGRRWDDNTAVFFPSFLSFFVVVNNHLCRFSFSSLTHFPSTLPQPHSHLLFGFLSRFLAAQHPFATSFVLEKERSFACVFCHAFLAPIAAVRQHDAGSHGQLARAPRRGLRDCPVWQPHSTRTHPFSLAHQWPFSAASDHVSSYRCIQHCTRTERLPE